MMVNVLLVDDSNVMRGLLRAILQSSPFLVIGEAEDGLRALEMVAELNPNLVCLDIEMPGASGLEILRELKAKYPAIGVVMVTASDVATSVQEALTNGADGYILKPFNAGKVLDTLQFAYEKIQMRC